MENTMMLLLDKNVHPLGGEYLGMDEPKLSAIGTDYALKYVRHSTPTITMSSTKA